MPHASEPAELLKKKASCRASPTFYLRFSESYKATMRCVVLYCLQGFPEFILEDTAYLLQIEFLFFLNHAGV